MVHITSRVHGRAGAEETEGSKASAQPLASFHLDLKSFILGIMTFYMVQKRITLVVIAGIAVLWFKLNRKPSAILEMHHHRAHTSGLSQLDQPPVQLPQSRKASSVNEFFVVEDYVQASRPYG